MSNSKAAGPAPTQKSRSTPKLSASLNEETDSRERPEAEDDGEAGLPRLAESLYCSLIALDTNTMMQEIGQLAACWLMKTKPAALLAS